MYLTLLLMSWWNDNIILQVIKTLKAAMQASITDMRLNWELSCPQHPIQLPREIPPVFSGERLIVYNIVTKDEASTVSWHQI